MLTFELCVCIVCYVIESESVSDGVSLSINNYSSTLFGCFFFQSEDCIRDLVRSRGLGDVYKRQAKTRKAPDSVCRLSAMLESKLLGHNEIEPNSPFLSLIHI